MATRKVKLDPEEQEILASVEAGEWESVPNLEAEMQRHREYAREAMKKDKRISLRISAIELAILKQKAYQEGIPYQTLIGSILHKYLSGRLVERRSR